MSARPARAVIVGAFEHPRRVIADRTTAEVIADVALGALADAGLTLADVDGYFTDSITPGFGSMSIMEYLGLRGVRHFDSTESGGATYPTLVGHACDAIAAGKCRVALVTQGGRPLSGTHPRGTSGPEDEFVEPYGFVLLASHYALAARRHMYEFGTTSAQLAEVKAAASQHAQHNANALRRDVVTVEEVLASPMVADPLHRLDCCVTTDGGGALVVVAPEVARALPRRGVAVLGTGESVKRATTRPLDLTHTPAVWSAPPAFAEAGVTPADIDYASVYDSFTVTVVEAIEDLGFCDKGAGGRFVLDGALVAPHGRLPLNTDGGGLCNNHPAFRGGMIRTIEAVRQLRGEATPAVQVPDCELAVVQAVGGSLGLISTGATLILGVAA